MTITTTTDKAILEAIGAAVDPGDTTVVDYQMSDIRGNYDHNQIWVVPIRNDRTKILKDLFKNSRFYYIVCIYVAGVDRDPDTVRDSLATLASDFFKTVKDSLVTNYTFSGKARHSEIESETDDGGYYAASQYNPKAVMLLGFRAIYYSSS